METQALFSMNKNFTTATSSFETFQFPFNFLSISFQLPPSCSASDSFDSAATSQHPTLFTLPSSTEIQRCLRLGVDPQRRQIRRLRHSPIKDRSSIARPQTRRARVPVTETKRREIPSTVPRPRRGQSATPKSRRKGEEGRADGGFSFRASSVSFHSSFRLVSGLLDARPEESQRVSLFASRTCAAGETARVAHNGAPMGKHE